MSNDLFKTLGESIVAVYDEFGNKQQYKKVEIKLSSSKYSSSHKQCPTLFLDDEPFRCKGHDKKKITYKCRCGNYNTILLCRFLTKQRLACSKCVEDEERRKHQSEIIRSIKSDNRIKSKEKKLRIYDFQNESEEFKCSYYNEYLTEEEFNEIRQYLYSVNGINVEGKEIIYLPTENGTNAKKYRPMVVIDDKKVALQDIWLKCANCGKVFHITRRIKERALSKNYRCKDCYLNNITFAVRYINDKLTYQGGTELKFIEECNRMGVNIENGPNIDYMFKNKKHYYKVDFYLPDYNKIVEIKDNHIWHKKQIENGKWGAKENAAYEYCQNNNLTYHLLFPNDIDNFLNTLKEIV